MKKPTILETTELTNGELELQKCHNPGIGRKKYAVVFYPHNKDKPPMNIFPCTKDEAHEKFTHLAKNDHFN